MKLGNRKVVIGGLTAVAFTSLTAFANATPDTTSDTTLSAPLNFNYHLAAAEYGGIAGISTELATWFMPGQVDIPLDNVAASVKLAGGKAPVNTQAGIARVFAQSVTLDKSGDAPAEEHAQTVPVVKTALGSSQEAEADTVKAGVAALVAGVAEVQPSVPEEETVDMAEEAGTIVEENIAGVNPAEIKEAAVPEAEEAAGESTEDTVDAAAVIPQSSMVEEEEPSEWEQRGMANVEESVNIRAEASEESPIVGKLYKGAAADILERGEEWTKITSGNVTEGYVKNEYLAVGEEAEALAEEDGTLVATVQTDGLRLRSDASEEAEILDLIENGKDLKAVSYDEKWTEVEYTEDSTAFVASDYVNVEYVLGKAVTIEEEEAIRAEKARKEAEARQAEIAKSEEANLLAALVKMEAGGESYEGKLAVASVVMNRVRSGAYPNSVKGVIYQSGQFPGAGNGRLAGILAAGVGGDSKRAAVEALSGITNVSYLHFNGASRVGGGHVIGNHAFY